MTAAGLGAAEMWRSVMGKLTSQNLHVLTTGKRTDGNKVRKAPRTLTDIKQALRKAQLFPFLE